MHSYPRLAALDIGGKRVLLRAGFDVPMEDGVVTDISRIEAVIPTMRDVLAAGASLVVMAHQGRPKGTIVPAESQKPLVSILERLLERRVSFATSCTGPEATALAQALAPGDVLLLENLRFDPREEANDPAFARELAILGDVYVNDAFSNAHRAHASMVGVPALLPSAMGRQCEKEVDHLSRILNTKEGLCVIVSGAKLETKVPVIEAFIGRAETIVVGGAIANTFLAAQGFSVGSSLSDPAEYSVARRILEKAGSTLLLPLDVWTAATLHDEPLVRDVSDILSHESAYDLGPRSTEVLVHAVSSAKTIVWNGPLGCYEEEAFSHATQECARTIADATARGAFSVIGGGDTIDACTRYRIALNSFSFVSTGGGAMLEFLANGDLPALEVLRS